MNRIVLMGRLVKDLNVKMTPSEETVCTFTLAVDRPYRDKDGTEEADFINVVTWGKTVELCGNSIAKGHRLLCEGRLQIRNYEKDGTKKWVAEVIADRVEFIEKKEKPDTPKSLNVTRKYHFDVSKREKS